jgi:cytochrome c peroxidase
MIGKRKLLIPGVCLVVLLLIASLGIALAEDSLTPEQQLGKSIFFDQNLSINRNQSCAVCHAPEAGWTGPLSDINAGGSVYEGSILGRFGDRKPPSSAYATLSPIFYQDKKGLFVGGNFWDGRATGEVLGNPAADQALGPFLNHLEQALPDSACVVYRVCTASYPVSFEEIWGGEACDISWPADVEVACASVTSPGLLILMLFAPQRELRYLFPLKIELNQIWLMGKSDYRSPSMKTPQR